MTDTAPQTRSRADRAEEVTESRRNRYEATAGDLSLRRFGVPDSILDPEKYIYRAAVDRDTRLIQLTKNDDYDFVIDADTVTGNPDQKGVVRYQSGKLIDGSPEWTYLLRKPKKFADEHRARSLEKLKIEERARMTETPGDAPEQAYKPGRG